MTYNMKYFEYKNKRLQKLFLFNRDKFKTESVETLVDISYCIEQWYYSSSIEQFDMMVVIER